MSENEDKLSHIDAARLKRMSSQSLYGLLENYDVLTTKFMYGMSMTKKEAIDFITYCKFFMDHGPTESIKLRSRMLYERHIKGKIEP